MEELILEYIKPELVVVSIVLYFIGVWIKNISIKDKFIPFILGGVGSVICIIYVFATSDFSTTKDVLMCIFTGLVQGILSAGLSNYVNQMIKQLTKEE